MNVSLRRMTAILALASMAGFNLSSVCPAFAGTAADDLRQIEYRYYFRGKYQQAIETLQTFLARVDLEAPERTRAQEFLAASYVLGGAPAMGKEVFSRLIKDDPAYPGPDPKVFKLEVVNTYAEARSEYAALTLKNVPAGESGAGTGALPAEPVAKQGKPIYKKWWLYAGAVALVALAAAGSGGDESAPAPDKGTVAVGVRVQ